MDKPKQRHRIVIADDEEGLLFLMVNALRQEGLEVEGFGSGKEVLEWLTRESAELLVLDLKLFDLPAPLLIERLRERGRDIPFIVVTGHGDERTAVEVMKQGALDYVMKESGMLELIPAIVHRALRIVERERELALANSAIRQREELLQGIVQTALDGFVRFDSEWKICEVNKAFCEMLDRKPEQLLRLPLARLEALLPGEHLVQRTERLSGKESAHCFLRFRRGEEKYLEVEVSIRAHADGFFAFVHNVSEQRRLEREVLQISESERHHFGRELHDGLGQQLTAIELMSHTLARQLKTTSAAQSKAADEIATLTREAVAQARRTAHGLAPVALEADGLIAALNDLARVTSGTGVECEFQCDAPIRVHDVPTATHLFRIAQEGVNNALKHANAQKILIRLSESDHGLQLMIQDDGIGLGDRHESGMGLNVMKYRARLIGARVHIHSRRGGGVRLICSLPKSS